MRGIKKEVKCIMEIKCKAIDSVLNRILCGKWGISPMCYAESLDLTVMISEGVRVEVEQ